MLILEKAIGVDGEGCRNCSYAEGPGELASLGMIAGLSPGHAVLCDEVAPLGFIFVETDAYDGEGLAVKAPGNLFDVRQCFPAGTAPGGPEVDEDDFAIEAVEGEGATI